MTLTAVCWSQSGRTAFVTEDGEAVTYGQLQLDVLSFAGILPKRELVFLLGSNDYSTVIAYLACLEAGAVPLLLDSSLSPESFANLFNCYQPSFLFSPRDHTAFIGPFESIGSLPGYSLYHRINSLGPELNPDLALLLATSGSTGSPKLVRLSLENLFNNAQSISEYLEIQSGDRAITSLPFNYSYGLSVINSHLVAGASIVLSRCTLFDAKFWQQMKSYGVTSLAGVPYSYDILLKLRFQRMTLPSLHTLTQAGGKMDPSQASRVYEICKAKGMRFVSMYGQTEATARIAFLSHDDFERKVGSVRRPIPGGKLWIEDDLGRRVCQHNSVGELVYSGPNVALGYAETSEDLIRGDDWGGVLHTGDLARQDAESFFFIEGRKQRFLKIFGVRISLDAVEVWFSKRGVIAAAQGSDDCLRVYIEHEEADDAKVFLAAMASDMQIHPSAVEVNVLGKIPRLNSGKVDYLCLKATR